MRDRDFRGDRDRYDRYDDRRDDRRPMDDRYYDDRPCRTMDDRDRARGSGDAWCDYRGPDDRDRDRRGYFDDRDRLSDPGRPGRPTPRWMSDAKVSWLH